MKKNVTILFAAMMPLFAFSQNDGDHRIFGTVKNNKGEAIRSASVVISDDSASYQAVADRKGEYSIYFAGKDTFDVVFSSVGYAQKRVKLMPEKSLHMDVTLDKAVKQISEVVVESRRSIGMTAYIPNRYQTNSANSGIGLLSNLMIPGLDVNRITGTVEARDQRKISYYIDGRESSQQEVEALRPKDIVRVEYHDQPTGLFAGKELVLNYVLRRYDYGGYVDLRTHTTALYTSGDYSGRVTLDRKKTRYSAVVGTTFANDNDSYSETNSLLRFDNPIERTQSSGNGKNRTRSYYGMLQTVLQTQKMSFVANGGLLWNDSPINEYKAGVSYNPAVSPTSEINVSSSSKNLKPFLTTNTQISLGNHQYLIGAASYNYTRNKYDRSYIEDKTDILSMAKEDAHNAYVDLNYYKAWNNGNTLMVGANQFLTTNDINYSGTIASDQSLLSSSTILGMNYSVRGIKKLSLTAGISADFNYYSVNDKKSHFGVYLRPYIQGTYMPNLKNSLSFRARLMNSMASTSFLNATEQIVDKYEIVRGNPDLDVMKYLSGYVGYNLDLGVWSLNAFVNYFSTLDMAKAYYYSENGMMVNTKITDGNFYSLQYDLSNTLTLLNKQLLITAGAFLKQSFVRGDLYHLKQHWYGWMAKVNGYVGNFSFSAYFNSKIKWILSSPYLYTIRPDYGLSASYGSKGFFVEIGARKLFDKESYTVTSLDTPYYRYSTKSFSEADGRQVYIKLSYNFDFGRKTQRGNINVDTSVSSGILKAN